MRINHRVVDLRLAQQSQQGKQESTLLLLLERAGSARVQEGLLVKIRSVKKQV